MTEATCPHCAEDISDVIAEVEQKFEDYQSPDDVAGLRSAIQKEREAARESKKLLKAEREQRMNEKPPEDYEQTKTELAAAQQKIATLTTDLEASNARTTELETAATDAKVAAAITAAKGNHDLLMPVIKQKLADDATLDIAETLKTLRDDPATAVAFRGPSHNGGGSEPQKGSDTPAMKVTRTSDLRQSTMTTKEKNEFQKQHGLDALLDLPQ